jgi:heme exporter protein A
MTLAVNHLSFERNDIPLLTDLHFCLKPGELLQIRGANGSGKSTLLRLLAGYLEPTTGTIVWNNLSISSQRENYHSMMHYVGHQNAVKPYLTVYENLELYAALYNLSLTANNIHHAIRQVGLHTAKDAFAHSLSAGQQRRLALARLLLRSCAVWILDEPTTALDSSGQAIFKNLLSGHLEAGGIAAVSTHHEIDYLGQIHIMHLEEKRYV